MSINWIGCSIVWIWTIIINKRSWRIKSLRISTDGINDERRVIKNLVTTRRTLLRIKEKRTRKLEK